MHNFNLPCVTQMKATVASYKKNYLLIA